MPVKKYEVGYKKPPKHTRFKPGRAGNPKGRPKGSKNFKTELMEELHERIPIKENGANLKVSKQRAMLKSVTAKAVRGDTRAAMLIANLVFRYLHDQDAVVVDPNLSEDDKAILKNYQDRQRPERTLPIVRHRSLPESLKGNKK